MALILFTPVAISQKHALQAEVGRRVQVLYQETGAVRRGFS
jgi:hypothetical protein